MEWFSAELVSSFVFGVAFGTPLLALGIILGIWLGRRAGDDLTGRLYAEQAKEMVQGMFRWTSQLGDDLTGVRLRLEDIGEQISGISVTEQANLSQATVNVLTQFCQANEQLQKDLAKAQAALVEQAADMEAYLAQSRTDALTNLPNRRALDDELNRRHAEWTRYQAPYSLLLIDIDHFKALNDTHGHLAGDEVLQGVAKSLEFTMRESDLVTRFGGEEFAVVLPNTSHLDACAAAERARRAIEQSTYCHHGVQLHVTASCGLATAVANEELMSVIKRADEAMYAAKRAGRNGGYAHVDQRLLPILECAPALNLQAMSAKEVTAETVAAPQGSGSLAPPAKAATVATQEEGALEKVCDDLRRHMADVLQN